MAKFFHSSLLGMAMLCMALSITHSNATNNNKNNTKKLFIFGDSFLDTGNGNHSFFPWVEPFGITYPGHPTENGINFALGGSGLFHTTFNITMKVQMQNLQYLINQGYYSTKDLQSSIAFVSISINDYMGSNITYKNLNNFTKTVTKELTQNLRKLQEMGVGKVAVAELPPSGCLPQYAYQSPYPGNCNETLNGEAQFHNQLLKQKLKKLNKNGQHVYIYVDFYNGFLKAMDKFASLGNGKYSNPTKGCCIGEGPMACGAVYDDKKPKYTLCDHPDLSFFWDVVHPTQRGWHLVFAAVKHILTQLR